MNLSDNVPSVHDPRPYTLDVKYQGTPLAPSGPQARQRTHSEEVIVTTQGTEQDPAAGEAYKDTALTDPDFATPHQPNPFAAQDLMEEASRQPRTDKQGDSQPAGGSTPA